MTDFSRYSRQVMLREVGVNGQQLLRDSSALIIGLGGLGALVSQYLVGAGLGRVLLSDFDRVDRSNLHRQILYRESDIGRNKLEAALRSLTALNAEVELEALPGPLDDAALLKAARQVDVVLDCSDNFQTRFAVNRACVAARRPLVSGAAIRFEGQLAVFDLRRGRPCYACLYPDQGDNNERCEEAGVLGPVVGTMAGLQSLAALKILLGLDAQAAWLQVWDALHGRWKTLQLAADPECPVCAARRDT